MSCMLVRCAETWDRDATGLAQVSNTQTTELLKKSANSELVSLGVRVLKQSLAPCKPPSEPPTRGTAKTQGFTLCKRLFQDSRSGVQNTFCTLLKEFWAAWLF